MGFVSCTVGALLLISDLNILYKQQPCSALRGCNSYTVVVGSNRYRGVVVVERRNSLYVGDRGEYIYIDNRKGA